MALHQGKLPQYVGPVGDFSYKSLPEKHISTALKRIEPVARWVTMLNQLQAIASAFTTGVADEKTGFTIIGRSLCGSVASFYDVLCVCRQDEVHAHYDNMVELYETWAPRLTKAELDDARKSLEERIAAIEERAIPPVGDST